MKRWVTSENDASAIEQLQGETGWPRPLCAVLVARGFRDADAADRYLVPRLSSLSDPMALHDMERAAARIWKAIDGREPITVFGDYDVDGITSTALLARILRALGADVSTFLPHRVDDGYGLGLDALQKCIAQHHPACIVTVDCGTGSVAAVQAAAAAGIDVVVTDHHEPTGDIAPAAAMVNPKLGAPERARLVAGGGVAFKLGRALLERGRSHGHNPSQELDIRRFLDLVAVGTVADMVPLTGENRILSRHGLALLNRTESTGLQALIDVAGIDGEITAYHIGFMLGPRLNAAGRLDSAEASLRLLLSDKTEESFEIAEQLDRANRDRRDVEARIVEEAMADVESWYDPETHFGIVVAREGWHPGVIGIVASRLCARYYRPVVVIAMDEEGIGRGSCRSIPEFHIVQGLAACSAWLNRYGGHAMAAGLEVEQRNMNSFRSSFNDAAGAMLARLDLRPAQRIDAWLEMHEVDQALLDALDQLKPFGMDNPKPVWGFRRMRLGAPPRVVGQKHLKMELIGEGRRIGAIAFGMGDRTVPAGPVDVAGYLDINEYMGRREIQIVVQDFRPAELA